MRTIGKPQFNNPQTAEAYAVLSKATGTAPELATLSRMADNATGEAQSQIGDLIEAFIVKFGFPDDGDIRGDAEPLLPNGNGLTCDIEDLLMDLLGMRGDAPVKGRGKRKARSEKPRCTKGRSCGMSCVDQSKACEPDLSPVLKAAANAVGKGSSNQTKPTSAFDLGKAQADAKKAASNYAKAKAGGDAEAISIAWEQRRKADNILDAAKLIEAGKKFLGNDTLSLLSGGGGNQALRERVTQLEAAYDKVFDTVDDPFSTPEWKAYLKASRELEDAERTGSAPMDSVRSKLMSRTADGQAQALADNVTVMKSASRRHGEDSIKDMLTDFYQVTGGNGAQVNRVLATEERAYADTTARDINIGWGKDEAGTRTSLFHEAGHVMEESNDTLFHAMNGFRAARATAPPQPIGGPYDADEVAFPGNYISPYVGKVYDTTRPNSSSTEVLAMGLQHFSSADDMATLYRQDPEHFFLTIGALL